jgi:hypothetical protein
VALNREALSDAYVRRGKGALGISPPRFEPISEIAARGLVEQRGASRKSPIG